MTFERAMTTLREGSLAERLDLLADLRETMRRATLDLDAQIRVLEAAKRERLGWMTDVAALLEQQVKADCVAQAQSETGALGWQVVYTKGRVTWNTPGLEGYAVDHPEVLAFRKTGTPGAKIVKGQTGGDRE